MIVNVLEPASGVLLDPACGSGGMFVQTGDFVYQAGMIANNAMTFYGQEKVEYNSKLCLMNMAVHGLTDVIKSGDEANTFYHDAHNLDGCCDYVMANPPFNVDKVKSESALPAGRLPFGLPGVNKDKEVGNANYLWISYFYSYLNEHGRAGFVMASSATDSSGKDKNIREALIKTGHVDVMVSVANNFFYTKSLPCSLWFFDKGKPEDLLDKVLFIDARNYYTVVDRTLNEWTDWQLKNLNAIVWLYRGETDKYKSLLAEYHTVLGSDDAFTEIRERLEKAVQEKRAETKEAVSAAAKREKKAVQTAYDEAITALEEQLTIAKEACWLYEKFGDGVYQDVLGLCKIADRATIIEEKGCSLTPGAYVGLAPVEDDGVDFRERMAEIQGNGLVSSRQFDISRIDFDLLRREFARAKKKNLVMKDLENLIAMRLEQMIAVNPGRINYYERYQEIINQYNAEQDRATIEKTFMELMNLASSLDREQQRYVREGFSSDEELSLYDLLFQDNLSRQDIKKLKEVAVDLLAKIKAKIAELDHWIDKQETKAAVDNLIRDVLWEELPESYDELRISEYRRRIYEYVYLQYKEAA